MQGIQRLFHYKGIKRKIVFFLINRIYAGVNPQKFPIKRKLLCMIGCTIGDGTKIVGPIFFDEPFTIGKDCWVGKNLIIHGNGNVTIGNNCDIAPEVTILTGGHDIGTHTRRAGTGHSYIVTIGNGCWIGARSTLVGPVCIKDGSVVAACSCLVKDVPQDSLVAGVPARIVRSFENN